jgi:hypothetical protein
MVEKGFSIYDLEAGVWHVHFYHPKVLNYTRFFAGGDVVNYKVAATCNCGDYGANDAGGRVL